MVRSAGTIETALGMMRKYFGFNLPDDIAVAWARTLLLAAIVATVVSTSLAIGLEFAIYVVFATQPALRRRLIGSLRHPVLLGWAVFMAPILIGALYGWASWYDSLTSVFAWRRALYLPLALAVFDDEPSKLSAMKVFLLACVIGAVVSIVMAVFGLAITDRVAYGIIFQNYVVQAIAMSIAVAIALVAILEPDRFAGDRVFGNRTVMAAVVVLLTIDIVYLLPGRSGYAALVIMATAILVMLLPGSRARKLGAGAALAAVLLALLVTSPVTRSRVNLAVNEIEGVDVSSGPSSLGQRVVFQRTTLRMVLDRPFFGVGTGGFLEGHRPYVRDVAGWQGQDTGDPHNQFLKILAEQGLFGLLAMLFFLFQSFRCPAPKPFRQLATAILLGWCATSLANSHFSTFAEGRLIFFWLGAMLSGLPELRKPPGPIN
jgi:O-antigen ligase